MRLTIRRVDTFRKRSEAVADAVADFDGFLSQIDVSAPGRMPGGRHDRNTAAVHGAHSWQCGKHGASCRASCDRQEARSSDQGSLLREIVAHLADAEIVGAFRIRLILGSPGAHIVAYDQSRWVTSGHYDKRDPRKSAEQFRLVRDGNLALLRTLEPEQWKHYGLHSERGQESIEHIVRMSAGHDINHLRQIEKILLSE